MIYTKKILYKNRRLIGLYIISGIAIAYLTNYSANFMEVLVNRFGAGTLKVNDIVIYGIVLIALCVLNYLDNYPEKRLEEGLYIDYKLTAMEKLSRIDYQAYLKYGTGSLIQRIENGARAGKDILFTFYLKLIRELLPSICFSLFFIWRIHFKVALVIVEGYVLVFLVTNLLLKVLYRMKERILVNEEFLNHVLVRGFMEMVLFRMNKRFPEELRKAEGDGREIISSKTAMTMIHEAFFTIFALLIILVKIGILYWGWQSGQLDTGGIVALLVLVDNAYIPIAIFNVLFVQYKLDKTAFDRYGIFLMEPEEPRLWGGDNISNKVGSFCLERVGFAYGKDQKNVLHSIQLSIPQGQKIVLVGESGSGKSTVMKLLAGLLTAQEGEIRIDGQKLSDISLDSYYDHISYVPQESPIFDGTLRENIVFDKEVENDQIERALDAMCLGELSQHFSDGLATRLGEKGVALSGGERQRLALTRLLFQKPDTILLDEATSALDNVTEEQVMKAVRKHFPEQTLICIAHRLHAVRDFDRFVVFREGRIQADGSFEELIENSEYFRQLYQAEDKAKAK